MKKIVRIISIILATAILVSAFCFDAVAAVTNDKIQAKQEEIYKLQTLLKTQKKTSDEAKNKLNEVYGEIAKTEETKNMLLNQIESLGEEIDTTEMLIAEYTDYIALKEDEIKTTQEEMNRQEAAIVEFLRYEHENGAVEFQYIEFLLKAASLSDFLTSVNYIGSMMNHQERMMQDLEQTAIRLDSQYADLTAAKNEKEEYATLLNTKRDESNELVKQACDYMVTLETAENKYVELIDASEDEEASLSASIIKAQEENAELIKEEEEYRAYLKKLAEEEAERKRKAEEEAKKNAITKVYGDDSTFMWPVSAKSGYRISGWFGYEPNPIGSGIRFHKAVDIALGAGNDIYAAASGRVVTARYSSSYGNYVIILHDNGLSTLYAHASKLLCKTGDKVVQGDVIAKVGTTGSSTGNHLHFEIILENGRTRMDPMKYFTGLYKERYNNSPHYDSLNNPRKVYYTP